MQKTHKEKAISTFENGSNCSQAIFSTFGPELGLNQDVCLKITTAFGGGINRSGSVCGAVTGALMTIGLKYGSSSSNSYNTEDLTKKFIKLFKERNGTIFCRDLINHSLSTDEEYEHALKTNVFRQCYRFVEDSAEILDVIF